MRDAGRSTTPSHDSAPTRKVWNVPSLSDLPKLTQLTLASAIGGGGSTGSGGSTVFSLILAAGMVFGLGACSGIERDGPSPDTPAPLTMVPVTCRADVAAGTVDCAAPSTASGREIFGGQGQLVLLRSSNTTAGAGTFTTQVTIQNLSAQPIGTEAGNDNDSVYVFFPSAPVPNAGTVNVVANTSTFTAAGQKFYPYPGPLLSGATSSAATWTFTYSGAASFTFEVLVAASVPSVGTIRKWNVVEGPHAPWIRGVAAYGPTDALIVNNGVDFPRLTADGWGRIANPFSDGLVDVSATTSPDSYITVGNIITSTTAFVAWYRNNGWETLRTEAGHGYIFHSVWASDKDHVVAVGAVDSLGTPQRGLIVWKWGVGDTWHHNSFVGSGPIKWVDGDLTNGFAVAQSTENNILHFNGTAWTNNATFVSSGRSGAGIAVSTGNAGHYSFGFNDGSGGQAWGWNGSSFSMQFTDASREVAGLVRDGVGGTYIMAPVFGGGGATDVLQVSDGSAAYVSVWQVNWDRPRRPAYDGNGGLFIRDTTGLYRADMAGGQISEVTTSPGLDATDFNALFALGDDVFLGTTNGFVRKRVSGNWSDDDTGLGVVIRALWGTAECDMYAAAGTGIHHSACGGWSSEHGSTTYRAITGAGGTLAAVGDGTLSTKVSGVWSDLTTGAAANGGTWWGVWGTGANNIYAVGDNYYIARWNGSSWTRVVLPLVSPSDSTSISWKGIGGSGPNDIWVVGTSGHVLHWTGLAWIPRDVTGGPSFEFVAPVASGDAMVSADNGIWIAILQRLTRASDLRVIGNKGMMKGSGTSIWALSQNQLFLGTR